MLAGVSHDLRTPLTRMRLHTALASPSSDITAIDKDIEEMEQMIESCYHLPEAKVLKKRPKSNLIKSCVKL